MMKYMSHFKPDEELFSYIPTADSVAPDVATPTLAQVCSDAMKNFDFDDDTKRNLTDIKKLQVQIEVLDQMTGNNYHSDSQRKMEQTVNSILMNHYEDTIFSHLKKYGGFIGEFPPEQIICERLTDRHGNRRRFEFGCVTRYVPKRFEALYKSFRSIPSLEKSKAYRRRKLIAVPAVLFVLFLLLANTGCGPILQALIPAVTTESKIVYGCLGLLIALTLLGGLLIPWLLRETKISHAGLIGYVVAGTFLMAGAGGQFSIDAAETDAFMAWVMRLFLAAYFLVECLYLLAKVLMGRHRERKSKRKRQESINSFARMMDRDKDALYRYIRLLALWYRTGKASGLHCYLENLETTFEKMYEYYLIAKQGNT